MIKKVFFLLVLIVGVLQVWGQPEIIYGTVRTDGFQKVIKGALWSKRPEAKMIYNGQKPEGYDVHVLQTDCFVRFIDGEHNQFDRNYIVVPAGQKIYADKNGNLHLAICGIRSNIFGLLISCGLWNPQILKKKRLLLFRQKQ